MLQGVARKAQQISVGGLVMGPAVDYGQGTPSSRQPPGSLGADADAEGFQDMNATGIMKAIGIKGSPRR